MYKHIMVPIDGSDASNRGLREAIALARVLGARLTLLHIADELAMNYSWGSGVLCGEAIDITNHQAHEIVRAACALANANDIPHEGVLIQSIGGMVCNKVIEAAEQRHVDLIVMGTHGRRGLRRMALGSDAEQVVRCTSVPVLLVRQEGVEDGSQKRASSGQPEPTHVVTVKSK